MVPGQACRGDCPPRAAPFQGVENVLFSMVAGWAAAGMRRVRRAGGALHSKRGRGNR